MDIPNFEKIKAGFIVDEEEYSKKQLSNLMYKISPFCKITGNGQVFVIKKVPGRKILRLILSARFIAHMVDKKISEEISKEELKAYSNLKENVFRVRFAEMKKENFVEENKDHKVKVKSILMIEQFLEGLKEKMNNL